MKKVILFLLVLMCSSCAEIRRINEENELNHCFRVCAGMTHYMDQFDTRSCVCRIPRR